MSGSLAEQKSRPAFYAENGSVWWEGVRLDTKTVEHLLSLFDREHAVRPYLELDEAYRASGGVPRVSCRREAA